MLWRQNRIACWTISIVFFLVFLSVIIWISFFDYGDCNRAISDCRSKCHYSGIKNVLCPAYIGNIDGRVLSASTLVDSLNLQSDCAGAIVTLQDRCGCRNWRCWNNREPAAAASWIVVLVLVPLCLFAIFCTVDTYNENVGTNQVQTCRQVPLDKVKQPLSSNVNPDVTRAWHSAKAFDL